MAAAAAGDDDEDDEEDEEGTIVKILPYLYIGDVWAAKDRELLTANGITHIANLVSEDVDNFFPDAYTYFEVPGEGVISA